MAKAYPDTREINNFIHYLRTHPPTSGKSYHTYMNCSRHSAALSSEQELFTSNKDVHFLGSSLEIIKCYRLCHAFYCLDQ